MSKIIFTPEEVAKFQSVSDFKERMRKLIISQRNEMSASLRTELSDKICEHILMIDEVNRAQTVAVYASRANEPNVDLILKVLHMRGKNVLLPVLGDGLQRGWAKFTALSDLSVRIPGRPPEPSGPNLGESAAKEIDVFLMPALAISKSGARLGHGGGWYDRVLKDARKDAKFFAIIYEDELYEKDESFPTEDHDVLIHAVATDKQFYRISK